MIEFEEIVCRLEGDVISEAESVFTPEEGVKML
jgi:hypothetical protein